MNTVVWEAPITDPSGYGEATRNYLAQLDRHRRRDLEGGEVAYDLRALPRHYWAGEMANLDRWWPMLQSLAIEGAELDRPRIHVHHLTPEQYRTQPETDYYVGMTTFETQGIPQAWQQPMRSMDEIWTFTEWGKQQFLDAGVNRPIYVVPHGVDTELFHPDVDPLPVFAPHLKPDTYVIGSNFEWSERKNPGALLMAYFQAFRADDPVALVIKTMVQFANPVDHGMLQLKQAVDKAKAAVGIRPGTPTPPVLLANSVLSTADLPRFYGALDAFALPSRGEGWGLTYTEAMATGLPTIGVNWSGHTAFMNDANSYLVDKFAFNKCRPDQVGYHSWYKGMTWADVDVPAFAEAMRYVYENRDEAATKGKQARRDMKKLTWAAATKKIDQRLRAIFRSLS
jgi:glycosyltransferase involved in cell wall biosynthesis